MVKSKKESVTKVEAALVSKTKPSKKIGKRDLDIAKDPKKQKKELIEEVKTAPPKKKKKKAKVSTKKTSKQESSREPKTLFVGRLPFQTEKSDLETFFKEVGEVIDVRVGKGIAHVEFASVEAAEKGLKLNGKPLLGRNVLLDFAYTKPPPRSQQVKTIFVTRFDKSVGEDEMKTALREHFSACGEILRISLPWDREAGTTKGIVYLDLKEDGFNKALELNGSELGGWNILVTEASPKVQNTDQNTGPGNGETVEHPAKQV